MPSSTSVVGTGFVGGGGGGVLSAEPRGRGWGDSESVHGVQEVHGSPRVQSDVFAAQIQSYLLSRLLLFLPNRKWVHF